jgi:hypothetical protein
MGLIEGKVTNLSKRYDQLSETQKKDTEVSADSLDDLV